MHADAAPAATPAAPPEAGPEVAIAIRGLAIGYGERAI
ncbi:MAG: hypothetical protein RIS86_378, partial [Planctomycetota bacterium]